MPNLKRILRPLLPVRLRNLLWYWRSRELRQSLAAARMIHQRLGPKILTGPFAAMTYIEKSIGSSYPPKLLGTYEKELTPILEQILKTPYQTIVDIGAAEGYYAVGLVWRIPGARVMAYEAQTDQHALLLDLARLNNVDSRITLHGFCTPAALNQDLSIDARSLIISDCEGFEGALLDPTEAPALARSDLLVETHDFLSPRLSDELRKRFTPTHTITQIPCAPRTESDWPTQANFVPREWRLPAMQEHRAPDQTWLWMKASHGGSGGSPTLQSPAAARVNASETAP